MFARSLRPVMTIESKGASPLPLVSIGMPLYNAARYLREAVDALLDQDYANLEIIFCDDASTDETAAICADYVAADPRCRYSRNERNLGAAGNFNRAFALSTGEFFMWAAFDDLRQPRYVRLCLEALQKQPGAVMCCSDVEFIDEDGAPLDLGSYALERPAGRSAARRVNQLTKGFGWVDIYSLIRCSALQKTKGYRARFGGDVILTLELCLHGPVLHVPEPLWAVRFFISRSGDAQAQTIVATDAAARITSSYTDLAIDMLNVIAYSELQFLARLGLWNLCLVNLSLRNATVRRAIFDDTSHPIGRAFKENRIGDAVVAALLRALVYSVLVPAAALRRATKFVSRFRC